MNNVPVNKIESLQYALSSAPYFEYEPMSVVVYCGLTRSDIGTD